MQAFYLGCRGKSKFALIVSTHALFIIIRVVGNHAEIPTGNAVKTETYNGKPTDKNKIDVKLTTLDIKDSARHERKLLSGRKH